MISPTFQSTEKRGTLEVMQGIKGVRVKTKSIPKSAFVRVVDLQELTEKLFDEGAVFSSARELVD